MGNTHSAQKSRLEADASKSSWNSSDDYQWGYGRERAPDTWWMYYPAASGNLQSPINITPEETEIDDKCTSFLKVDYPSIGSKMVWNTGHSLQVEVRQTKKPFYVTGGILKNQPWELRQFHFHWGEKNESGSEHTVDNQSRAMEIHFVHWNTDFGTFEEAARCEGGLMILAVLCNLVEERSSAGIEDLVSYVPRLQFKRNFENLPENFDVRSLLPNNLKRYWAYKGSLTMPPCYESVQWIVFYDTLNVSANELEMLRTLQNHSENDRPPDDDHYGCIMKNLRPIQPMGTRKIISVEHKYVIGDVNQYYTMYDSTSVFTSGKDFTWTGGLVSDDEMDL